ncbi:MAG: Ni/Fe hydrogenase subunit alpha [Promethearchaeota archaeon]
MGKEIVIEPLTRLEGHGDLRVVLDDAGKVSQVQFNVTSTRFFEKFLEGRYMEHVPRITPRICGICPIPHHLAPTKAVEDAWGLTGKIPDAAIKLRRLLINAKQYASHALHFYALAAPDFVMGPFAPPEKRNVVAVINALPDVGKMALKMMDFGQRMCQAIGGKSVHPIAAVVGGFRTALTEEQRDAFLAEVEEQVEFTKKTVEVGLKVTEDYWDLVEKVSTPTWYVGQTVNGTHDIYDGNLRVMSPDGKTFDYAPRDYREGIAEHVAPHSMATHCYAREGGYPDGIYRANTLAMINVSDKMATPLAQEALQAFRDKLGRPCHLTLAYHWARLIELVESIELIAELLKDPAIVETDPGKLKLMDVQPREGRGVGLVEAPRGSLIYELWSDAQGICTKANLMVATNHNIAGIEKSVKTVAQAVLEGDLLDKVKLPEPWVK